jgi:hypothetical protein
MKRTREPALAVLFAAFALAEPCGAEPTATEDVNAEQVQACVEQHEQARLLRLREAWFDARAAMLRCADPRCPLALRSDCSAWLDEIARVLPTLLVIVERDDAGSESLLVELDEKPLLLPAEPTPIEVLPGRHTLRFSLGRRVIEQQIEIHLGEKNRVVKARFVRESPAPGRAPAPLAQGSVATPGARSSRPVPLATYLASAGALAAFTTSGLLLGSALASRDAALERCAPECHDGERESVDARLLAADLVGAAGLALGGVAIYTFVTRPVVLAPAELTAQGPRPRPFALQLSLGGRF